MQKDKMPSLSVPSHDAAPAASVETPKAVVEVAEENDSSVKLPLAPSSGIKVIALRKGFFNQHRFKEGDSFTVKDFSQLGNWMECVDPVLEKKRKEISKANK